MAVFSVITGWIFLISSTKPNTILNNRFVSGIILFLLLLYAGIEVGNKVVSPWDDMFIYISEYITYHNESLLTAVSTSQKEPLFAAFQWFLAQFSESPVFFKLGIWSLFTAIFFFALKKIFTNGQLLIVFFSYINFFIFYNYVTNTVRQGIAISLLMLAICCLLSGKHNKTFYIALILSPLFHFSSLPLSILLFLIKKINFSLKFILISWIIFAILFVTDLNASIFGKLSSYSNFLQAYSSNSLLELYNGEVNRLDFLLFSAFWIIVGLFIKRKWLKDDKEYDLLLKIYISFNIFFLMFGFVAFSDRSAAYSWILIPLLIWLPILKSSKPNRLIVVVILLVFLATGIFFGSTSLLI